MGNYRQDRVNDAIAKELSELMPTVKDYRVKSALVTVTAVDCTKDLKQAKVYVSAVGKITPEELLAGLKSAHGYLRTALAARLNLRATPELLFRYDDSMTHGANILRLLKEVGADNFAQEDAQAASQDQDQTDEEE